MRRSVERGKESPMATRALAAVQVADRKIEIQEFDLPRIGPNEGLLRIEACGICGSDYEQYNGELGGGGFRVPYPLIPGHEPLGIIEEIGEEAAQKWGVQKGARVAVEPIPHCGTCPLEQVEHAIRVLAREVPGEDAIHIAIKP